MKSKLRFTIALFVAAGFALSSIGRAEDNTPGATDPIGTVEGDPSGPLPPIREFHGFMLQPTADAPAGAAGWVVICPNLAPPKLRVNTVGLPVGTYSVNVTSKLDGSVISLGTFDTHLPVDPLPLYSSIAVGESDPTGGGFVILQGEASFAFPDGYDPANVASVQIANADGVTLLSGDNKPHDPRPGGRDHEHEQFILQPTADAPADARGHADIEVEDRTDPAAASATLKIETKGLADGTYTVQVTSLSDGSTTVLGTVDVAAVTTEDGTDSQSQDRLPFPDGFDPTSVASVQVLDASGTVLLNGDGSIRGGHVEGSEHLHERVVLTATADAPTGADGVAEIEAHDREGANTATLEIQTNGLDAGTYTVSVTSLADGSVTVLGTLDVAAANASGGDATVTGDSGAVAFDSEQETGLAFPDGFNPLDVAGIQVVNANGVVMLTGDFTDVVSSSVANFTAKVRITPGPAAPGAKGMATASSRARRHRVRQSFTLAAQGAPASSTLTVQVNGSDAGTVTTSRKGRVVLHKFSHGVNVHRITSVTLQDASGNTVLSAHF